MENFQSTYFFNKNKDLKISMIDVNSTYNENIQNINFLTIPTPTRLMGKDKEYIKKWRIYMDYKQKNGLLKNEDFYLYIL